MKSGVLNSHQYLPSGKLYISHLIKYEPGAIIFSFIKKKILLPVESAILTLNLDNAGTPISTLSKIFDISIGSFLIETSEIL